MKFSLYGKREWIFQSVDYDLWDNVLNFSFAPTQSIDYEVVKKPRNILTMKEKRKVKQGFQAK